MRQILFVDDDHETHVVLIRACASFARVLQATTAARANQVLSEHPVDVVVLEQRLKDSPGLRLLATIKARCPQLPVVVATAYGSERVCALALKLGARDYFIKPWAADEMAASLRAILASTQQQREKRRNVIGARMISTQEVSWGNGGGREASIRQVARRIAEHPWNADSFGQIARDLGLSKSALSQRFKRALKVPYRRFLQQSRVTHASELLRTSSLTITEIAHQVGFGDLPRFDKVFKVATGRSPSRYRQQQTTASQQPTSESA